MESQNFEQSNLILKAGDNPNTNDMPACKSKDSEGHPFLIGKFKLSEQERKRFLETGEIWLCVMGGGWPPVLPTTHNPFTELEFEPMKAARGLPDMEFREEIDKMLREIFFSDIMSNEKWIDFVETLSYPIAISMQIRDGIDNGKTLEEMLAIYKTAIINSIVEKSGSDSAPKIKVQW